MELLFSPLFSGSSGNCTYVGSRDAGVIVDCGVSATSALSQLNEAHIPADAVKAVLVTHEHTDHIGGAGVLARKARRLWTRRLPSRRRLYRRR